MTAPAFERLRRSAGVCEAATEDDIVLLDLRRGDYILLNEVAAAMWRGLGAGDDPERLIAGIAADFAAEPERVRGDLLAFGAQCEAQGLLERGDRPPSSEWASTEWPYSSGPASLEGTSSPASHLPPAEERRKARRPTWWNALRAIRQTKARLRRGGFVDAYRAPPGAVPPPPAGFEDRLLARAEAAFRKAEMLSGFANAPDDCLPRSLAIRDFLRALGLSPRHVIGIQRHPFLAHAWTECGGRVILDADRRGHFVTIATS